MKKKNLKQLVVIANDILFAMNTMQNQDKDLVYLPKSLAKAWQSDLFKIIIDESKDDNH